MATTGVGSAFRGLFVFLALVLLISLLALVVRSLLGTTDSSQAEQSIGGASAESSPTDTEPLPDVLPTGDDPIDLAVCGRPAGEGAAPFRVQIDDPVAVTEEVVVAVDLVGPDGSREPRRVEVPPAEAGPRQAVVPDSDDPARHLTCIVTGIQRGEQVILTGR